MPYLEPEFDDPQELVGIELPGDERSTREMAESFADEFAQLGFSRAQILALYRESFYVGAHQAWQLLGEEEVGRIVDESLAVWGRISFRVTDSQDDPHPPDVHPLHFVRPGS